MIYSNYNLTQLNSTDVKTCSVRYSDYVMSALSKVLNMNLLQYCDLKAITHTDEIVLNVSTAYSKVSLSDVEQPRSSLKWNDEPIELEDFSYTTLKNRASDYKGVLRGRFYGTIANHDCSTNMDCPRCDASGICKECSGNKKITCNVCHGTKECPACRGTGQYTCNSCSGSGDCPDCNGEGQFTCDDCGGSGEYVAECRSCGGSGWYREGVTCNTCDGTGEYRAECWNCEGTGNVECESCDGSGECSTCDGDGWVECNACAPNQPGVCGKCRGKGDIICRSCKGKGTCYKCRGNKSIICTRCEGSGVYQTFKGYELSETTNTSSSSTIKDADKIDVITGETLYNGVVYDFFARKANVNDIDKISGVATSQFSEFIRQWLSLGDLAPSIADGSSNDYFKLHAKLIKCPCTRLDLTCRSNKFSIWILGDNNCIYYDSLPGRTDRFLGGIGKFFSFGNKK